MKRFVLLMAVMIGVIGSIFAQQERKFIREGNDLFEKQDFEKAEVEYRKAADKKANSFEAAFNMADALYKQQKYEEALQQFSALTKQEKNPERLGEIFHNIGNTLLSMQKTGESIEAYKESLRHRPTSEATKYNLEFARQQQQQEQNQNKDNQDKDNQNQEQNQQGQNQDNKDQNKDEQNKDQQDQNQQNKDQQDKKDQQKNDQNKQDQQQNDQRPQEGKISKEDAKRLLEALQNDEKNVQEKVQKQKAQEEKARKMKIEKDW